MEKAKSGDLFAKKPEIHKLDILADLQDKKGGERLTRVIDPFPQVA
jgi:hypothetical protein